MSGRLFVGSVLEYQDTRTEQILVECSQPPDEGDIDRLREMIKEKVGQFGLLHRHDFVRLDLGERSVHFYTLTPDETLEREMRAYERIKQVRGLVDLGEHYNLF